MTQKLDFEFFYLAARDYEQEKTPLFWQMRQDSPESWSELVALLQNLPQTGRDQQALSQLLGDWAQPEALQQALLQCALPLLTRCGQELRRLVFKEEDLEDETNDPSQENTVLMAKAFLDLIEAHALASLVPRAPALLRETFPQLQGAVYNSLQRPFNLPENEADFPDWLTTQSLEQLEALKSQCNAQIESAEASQTEGLELFLTCLNCHLLPRQLAKVH